MSSRPGMTPTAARVIHAALSANVLIMVAVFALVRAAAGIQLDALVEQVLRFVGLAQLIGVGIAVGTLRKRIPIPQPDEEPAAWWQANGSRVLVLWAMAEGAATFGAVIWFLTADWIALIVVNGAALGLLVRSRPAAWTG